MDIDNKPATIADQAPIFALLARCALPLDGLADHLTTALVARQGSAVVGCVALELYGRAALLRSLAVDEPLRRQGVGIKLMQAALEMARRRGVTTIFLLTETASDFFLRLGFTPVDRAYVPPAVQQSIEFRGACPAGAQTMVRSLIYTARQAA